MEREYTKMELIEKIIRARVLIEARKPARRRHSDHCPVDYDSDYYGPCTCGASSANATTDSLFRDVLDALKL